MERRESNTAGIGRSGGFRETPPGWFDTSRSSARRGYMPGWNNVGALKNAPDAVSIHRREESLMGKRVAGASESPYPTKPPGTEPPKKPKHEKDSGK